MKLVKIKFKDKITEKLKEAYYLETEIGFIGVRIFTGQIYKEFPDSEITECFINNKGSVEEYG